jgi:fluoroquinolone resistance protein
MHVTNEVFKVHLPKSITWEDQVFQFCEFRGIGGEGLHIASAFLDCSFSKCDLYWTLANIATFVGVTFHGCVFRGCSFSGCRFVECTFQDCLFTESNLGGKCSFDGSRWYACKQSNTNGLSTQFASP